MFRQAVVRGEDLVIAVQLQASDDGRHPAGGVRHEGQAGRVSPEEASEGDARLVELVVVSVRDEAGGIGLELFSPAPLGVDHHPRRRPERPVVEMEDVWIERSVVTH